MNFLGPPELSDDELDRERRKRRIAAALTQARSRLDTVHGLVRCKKPEDAALIAQALLVDLANLLLLLGKGNPVTDPASAAKALLESQVGGGSIQSRLAALARGDAEAANPSADLVDSLFWAVREVARRTMATELKTSLDQHELKRRWQVAITVGLMAGALITFLAFHQRAEARRYASRLAQLPAFHEVDRSASYLRRWLLTGPIDGPHGFGRNIDVDFLETAGGEPYALPEPGTASRLIDDTVVTWKPIENREDVIDLIDLLGQQDDAVAYAFTTIDSPHPQTATLFMGSDDGIKVWLNGETVYNLSRLRILKPDEDRVDVKLREGTNALLLKITQRRGFWGFTCRIAPQAGSRVP